MADKNVKLKDGSDYLFPQTNLNNISDMSSSTLTINSLDGGLVYTTDEPTADNEDGLKICVLNSEPANRYDGWFYIITGGAGYLCFTAKEANSTVELIKVGSPSITNTAYSLDGDTWVTFTPSATSGTNTITLTNIGDKVYFKNDINSNFSSGSYLQFVMTGSLNAGGNVNSMYVSQYFDDISALTYTYCFYRLFKNCTALANFPKLPASSVGEYSYYEMFYGCNNASGSIDIPLTTVGTYSCYKMFFNCYKLNTVNMTKATTGASYAYYAMFQNCFSLVSGPEIINITNSYQCSYMFKNCKNLIVTPVLNLPATAPSYSCQYMFSNCSSLTKVPKLTSTYFDSYCYYYMFYGCSSLKVNEVNTGSDYVWRIPDQGTTPGGNSQSYMFWYCDGLRMSNSLEVKANTYYTQNEPI